MKLVKPRVMKALVAVLVLVLAVWGCGLPSSQVIETADSSTTYLPPDKYPRSVRGASIVVTGEERLEDKLAAIDDLSRITVLSFMGTNLVELPAGIAKLPNVAHMSVSGNYYLKTLPAAIGSLAKLRRIAIYHNDRLTEVPAEICQLDELGYLGIEDNGSLESLPECMAEMHSLERIYLHDTNSRMGLWEPLGKLANLEEFSFWVKGTATPEILADKLIRLPNVKNIDVTECDCARVNGRIALPAVACKIQAFNRISYACLPS